MAGWDGLHGRGLTAVRSSDFAFALVLGGCVLGGPAPDRQWAQLVEEVGVDQLLVTPSRNNDLLRRLRLSTSSAVNISVCDRGMDNKMHNALASGPDISLGEGGYQSLRLDYLRSHHPLGGTRFTDTEMYGSANGDHFPPRMDEDIAARGSAAILPGEKHLDVSPFLGLAPNTTRSDPRTVAMESLLGLLVGNKGEDDDSEQAKNFNVGGVNLPSGQSFDLRRSRRHPPLLAEVGLFGGLGVIFTLLLYKGLSAFVESDVTEDRRGHLRGVGFWALVLCVLWLFDYLGRVLS